MREGRSAFEDCYKQNVSAEEEASGKIVVQFTLGTDGDVLDSSVVVDSVGNGVGACVKGVVDGLAFEAPSGGGVVAQKTFVYLGSGEARRTDDVDPTSDSNGAGSESDDESGEDESSADDASADEPKHGRDESNEQKNTTVLEALGSKSEDRSDEVEGGDIGAAPSKSNV